jgi:hypothetical protein
MHVPASTFDNDVTDSKTFIRWLHSATDAAAKSQRLLGYGIFVVTDSSALAEQLRAYGKSVGGPSEGTSSASTSKSGHPVGANVENVDADVGNNNKESTSKKEVRPTSYEQRAERPAARQAPYGKSPKKHVMVPGGADGAVAATQGNAHAMAVTTGENNTPASAQKETKETKSVSAKGKSNASAKPAHLAEAESTPTEAPVEPGESTAPLAESAMSITRP